MSDEPRRSPYRGLTPYGPDDSAYFFGREEDVKRLSAYLGASTLTVVYGASGVGKSSVLRAGLEFALLERARARVEATGRPGVVVAVVREWLPDPAAKVLDAVRAAWAATGASPPSIPDGPLPEVLEAWAESADGSVYLLCDQFEEYLLYHGADGGTGPLGDDLARIANDPGSRASVLLALREDSIAQLDRFKNVIPGLLASYLRIEHLDFDAARSAIEKPLGVFRERVEPIGPASVDPRLCDAVLEMVRVAPGVDRVEPPYLQLLMGRLWGKALADGSEVIDRSHLRALGDEHAIVRSHVDEALDSLSPTEQNAAAEIFDKLVTPSGSKMAQTIEDLAAWAGLREERIGPMLRRLSEGETRILREVPPPLDRPLSVRYEIFHDVLARSVLDWVAEHRRGRRRRKAPTDERPVEWIEQADGVFSAGGIRMFALAGALLGFAEHYSKPVKQWVNVAGASGGAVIAALLATGHDVGEIDIILREAPFQRMTDRGAFHFAAKAAGSLGEASGDYMRSWIDSILVGKTFAATRAEDGYFARLKLIAADVTHAVMLILPDDLVLYALPGEVRPIDPATFPIADAVRMSMALPFFFPPVELVRLDTGRTAQIVDGGIFSEIPVWLMDVDTPATPLRRPTFGFRVRSAQGAGRRALSSTGRVPQFAKDVVRTASEIADKRLMSHSSRVRTCVVDTGGVGTTDFGLSAAQKVELVVSGRDAARNYLDHFTLADYSNTYGRAFGSSDR